MNQSRGIGDYVHWHASRYLEYGTGRISKSGGSAAKAIIDANRELTELYSNKIKMANWEIYEGVLQDAIYPPEVPRYSYSIGAAERTAVFDEVNKYLTDEFDRITVGSEKLLTEFLDKKTISSADVKKYTGSSRKNKQNKRVYNTEIQ